MKRVLLAATMVLLICQAAAAPVADDERVAIDLRRTTLIVRDIDRSLALYRDALGMMVSVLTDPDGFVIELNQLLVEELR